MRLIGENPMDQSGSGAVGAATGYDGWCRNRAPAKAADDDDLAPPQQQRIQPIYNSGLTSYRNGGGGSSGGAAGDPTTPKNGVHIAKNDVHSPSVADDIHSLAARIANDEGVAAEAMQEAIQAAERAVLAVIARYRALRQSKATKAAARRIAKEAARSTTNRQSKGMNGHALQPQQRFKNGKLQLPVLPDHLSWPTKKYSEFRSEHGRGQIVEFLRDREIGWPQLIEAGFNELRWLRMMDSSAARGIECFERKGRKLPSNLRFLTEQEVTELNNRDLRLAVSLVSRIRRGNEVPSI